MESEQQTPLTPQLENVGHDDKQAIKGALTALFEAYFAPELPTKYATAMVDEHGYDCVPEFRTIGMVDLHEIGIPRGHQKRVARAIFNGALPTGVWTTSGHPRVSAGASTCGSTRTTSPRRAAAKKGEQVGTRDS